MITFNLWLEAKRKKRVKKVKPASKVYHDMDSWLKELELLSKDIEKLQQAKKKYDADQIKKKSTKIVSSKKSSTKKYDDDKDKKKLITVKPVKKSLDKK